MPHTSPFTTIEPNRGVAFVHVDCPCKKYGKTAECNPRQGKCVDGKRSVPLQFLDVAGLVPGASTGAGLGNQFLGDLCAATCLVHVVDVSGTTDANGKETVGYDPINDIDWLRSEIHSWIFHNLYSRWPTIVRKHVATKSSVTDTLQAQLGGYGTSRAVTNQVLDKFDSKDPLEAWSEDAVKRFLDVFLDVRFPTVIALNKIDLPDSDKNIDRISRKYDQSKIVLISALAENFLRKLHKQKFIHYYEGTDSFELAEDADADTKKLHRLDDKTRARLERVQDLVLFRFGHTGVQECLQTVVAMLGLVPVFPVKNVNNFSSSSGTRDGGVFRDCFFVRPRTTMRQLAHIVHPDLDKHYLYSETVGNVRLAEDDVVTSETNVVSFKTSSSMK
ncbi:hypothetical protein HDV03_000184 [Kappamyces sp. JEL0829]|nr:hypothetical protein HDV03_000184 [Kappamyces sp. JEL0829]